MGTAPTSSSTRTVGCFSLAERECGFEHKNPARLGDLTGSLGRGNARLISSFMGAMFELHPELARVESHIVEVRRSYPSKPPLSSR